MTSNTDTAGASEKNWYLIHCKPRQDERAEENLALQGYEISRPKRKCQRVLRGKLGWAAESLFPGYLFIYLPPGSNRGPLRSTRGVSRVVSFGGIPLPISDRMVRKFDDLFSIEIAEAEIATHVAHNTYAYADGLNEILDSNSGAERVVLLIKLLNCSRLERVA
jgi:transcriptional antiterminator RfaH